MGEKTVSEFHKRHELLYGFSLPEEDVEIVCARVTAIRRIDKPKMEGEYEEHEPKPKCWRRVRFDEWIDTAVYGELKPGAIVDGPAIVEMYDSTLLIPPDKTAKVDPLGGEDMFNTAYSPNIRDRLDFSCAIALEDGRLVAQAEPIPVHLGSMAVGLRNLANLKFDEGDVWMVNDPYVAGTHLNDVMMVKPLFYDGELVALVANKAHHVDIGGCAPGSMNPNARELWQEGMVIPPIRIVEGNELRKDVSEFQRVRLGGGDSVRRKVREGQVGGCPKGVWRGRDHLEWDGKFINVDVEVKIEEDCVNFEGTHDSPINAVYGVTVASTCFALKSLLDPEMPMNYGFFNVVDVKAPKGTIVNPIKPAPVSIGNVETSQRIVDAIYKALSNEFPIPAASHGSMNNVLIGGRDWEFYETIGGGSGARPNGDGVDGVHVNMTNTMNTPVEVIEREYPLRVLEYSFRPNSGGMGKYRGGLGLRRVIEVLEPSTLTVIAERIRIRPWGLRGGKDGASGRCYVIKRNSEIIILTGKDTIELEAGDRVVIETPGGGGYDDPKERREDDLKRDLEDGKVTV